jgi:hypothetical protein
MAFPRVKPMPWMWAPAYVDPRARWLMDGLLCCVPFWRPHIVEMLTPQRGNDILASNLVTAHAAPITRIGQTYEKTASDSTVVNLIDPTVNAIPAISAALLRGRRSPGTGILHHARPDRVDA